ncbi:solute:sodium symporter family transporter [Fusobacterium sp.]|uniref:solute:sodium symporter family transporter n=1 Tax=Fusobacterium sp. TaxID=68766 RepID=UPI0026185665|nr:solute:sodium symporter family transporter [Fusobacterium sp.]
MLLTVVSFIFFTALVAVISWWKTKEEKLDTADGYFLAGRGLSGIVIAGSMLLTNISAEQIVGLSGQAYMKNITGMAWESTAAVATIMLAVFFLPYYLKRGFTTMPQFLEERYDASTRKIISLLLLTGYVLISTPAALYAGAVAFNQIFNLESILGVSYVQSIWILVWVIGIIGSIYAVFGGLKAVAVSDTINGIGLVVGGLAVPFFGLLYLGKGSIKAALMQIATTHIDKINAIGGPTDPIPFGTIFTGMIFANMFYWCTNQVLIQRTLGAENLKEGQKGVLLSGFMKILIPVIVSLPGVIAFHIFGSEANLGDAAYPRLVAVVLPKYLVGFYSAVIFGAVLSTYNSLLNSAATLFCFDVYKPVFAPNITDENLIKVAKIVGTVLALFSMFVAPFTMYAQGGLFEVMRRFTGFFNIPTICIVLVGLFSKKITALSAKIVIFTHLILYTILIFVLKIKLNYVHIMGLLFVFEVILMNVISIIKPAKKEYEESKSEPHVDMTPWRKLPLVSTLLMGLLVFVYIFLSPIGVVSDVKLEGSIVGPNFKFAMIGLVIFMGVFYKIMSHKIKKHIALITSAMSK